MPGSVLGLVIQAGNNGNKFLLSLCIQTGISVKKDEKSEAGNGYRL